MNEMNTAELMKTLMSGEPVICEDIHYPCISALIYRKSGSEIVLSVELPDSSGNSITIARSNQIKKAESEDERNANKTHL